MLRRISLSIVLLAATSVVSGQDPSDTPVTAPPRPALTTGTAYREKSPARLEAEQRWQRVVARAQLQAAGRLARQERNAWLGHSPLRPTISDEVYRPRVHYVPVYYDWLASE